MPQPQSQPSPQPRNIDWRAARALALTSAAFADGATIPRRHTADGADLSPPLTWEAGPEGTKSFAILCEDPDSPKGLFVHWLVFGIPADMHALPEGVENERETRGIKQGTNGFGRVGWGGPKPPPGKPHRYVFRLFALDDEIDLAAGSERAALDRAIEGHVLSEAVLIGTYSR
jgi:Raf kinase inhibitor-like YbhB/YbcL family protein